MDEDDSGWRTEQELRAALPLIADVVEAAEETREFGYAKGRGPLDAALTALRDALEEK